MTNEQSPQHQLDVVVEALGTMVQQIADMRQDIQSLQDRLDSERDKCNELSALIATFSKALAQERSVCDKLYQYVAELNIFGSTEHDANEIMQRYLSLRQTYSDISS